MLVHQYVNAVYGICDRVGRFYFWATLNEALKGEEVPWAKFCSSDLAYKPSCFSGEPEVTVASENVPLLIFTNASTEGGVGRVSAAQQYFDRGVLGKVR